MTTGKTEETVKGVLLKLIKILSISVGSIFGLFLLLLLLVTTYTPTNPPDQYKTPVIYSGVPGMKVDFIYSGRTPEGIIWEFMDRTTIIIGVTYTDRNFIVFVDDIIYKEEALRLLRLGIADGKVYVDEQNYLVTE